MAKGMHPTHGGARMASGGASMHNMGDHPGHKRHAEGGDVKISTKLARGGEAEEEREEEHQRRKGGGGLDEPSSKSDAKVHMYNAEGSPEASEAKDEKPGFGRGGRKRKAGGVAKDGGLAVGGLAAGRADRARRASGGGTPYSTGHNLTAPTDDKDSRGHEGTKAA